MKTFEIPEVEIVKFETEDILSASSNNVVIETPYGPQP